MRELIFCVVPIFGLSTVTKGYAANSLHPLQDYQNCTYQSGRNLRDGNASLLNLEKGAVLKVPLDYSDPGRGSTEIYAYTAKPFNPSLPTYALLLGGPGQHAHIETMGKFEFYSSLPYNFLILEQRGIGFSRFETEELQRDARNYGSETTARDLKSVLDYFHIAKASIYGTSYGTVPATIFGNLYPERTQSVVLEGVVYNGWLGVMNGSTIQRQIQKFYSRLPQLTKDALDRGISENRFNVWWLPTIVQSLMLQSGSQYLGFLSKALIVTLSDPAATPDLVEKKYEEFALPAYKGSLSDSAQARLSSLVKATYQPDECKRVVNSDDVNQLLMIKEFSAGDAQASGMWKITGGRIIKTDGSNYTSFAQKFTHVLDSRHDYSADQYPLKVPTFYLQGVADGATANKGAIEHFKKSTRGMAQLFLFDKLGHMPIGQIITSLERSDENWTLLQNFFETTLRGQIVSCEMQTELKKTYTDFRSMSLVRGKGRSQCRNP